METTRPGIKWLRIALLFIAVVMIFTLIFVNVNDLRFVSSNAALLYTWIMLMALFTVFLLQKGVLRIIFIVLMGFVTLLLIITSLYLTFAPWENNIVPKVHKLRNDSRVAVIANPEVNYDFSVTSVRFLAKPYFFGLFYKPVTPIEVMEWHYEDPNMLTDPNVLDYELPAVHGAPSYLFVVKKESLLVDAQKGMCTKVKKKPARINAPISDSLSLDILELQD